MFLALTLATSVARQRRVAQADGGHVRKRTRARKIMNLAHDDKKRAEYIRFGHLSCFSTKRRSEQTGFALLMVYVGLLAMFWLL